MFRRALSTTKAEHLDKQVCQVRNTDIELGRNGRKLAVALDYLFPLTVYRPKVEISETSLTDAVRHAESYYE